MRRAVVVDKVRELGLCSRTQIVNETGLSPSTITHVVRELMAEGVLQEVGSGESRGGRRTTLLRFQEMAELVGFVEVKDQGMTVSIAGWNGDVVQQMSIPTQVESIATAIHDVRDSLPGTLRAVCLAVPGIASETNGEVGLAPALREIGSDSLSRLGQLIDVPVVVDNDVNLILLGEHAAGVGAEHQDIALLHVASEGIGAALMLDGAVRTGAHGSAGEVGFLPLTAGGFHKDDMGAFEASWSGDGLRRRLADLGIETRDDVPHLRTLVRHASRNPAAAELLTEAIDAWVRAAVSIVCVVDPAVVILSGEIAAADDELIEQARLQFRRYWPKDIPLIRSRTPSAMLLGGVRRGFAAAEKNSLPG